MATSFHRRGHANGHPKWEFTRLARRSWGRVEEFSSANRSYAEAQMQIFAESHRRHIAVEVLHTLGKQCKLRLLGGWMQLQRTLLLFVRDISARDGIPPCFLLIPFSSPRGSDDHQVKSPQAQATTQSMSLAKQSPHLSQVVKCLPASSAEL